MFIHHLASFFDLCAPNDSMQLLSAYAVERELQESRRKEQLEKSGDNISEHSSVKPLPYRG